VSQLSLFGGGDPAPTERSGLVEPHITDEDREIAERVPSFVRFGTSSWSFPGWAGIVWKGNPNETTLARGGLEAYARHPLLRAVSVDRSAYRPLTAEDIAGYEHQVASAQTLATKANGRALPPFRMLYKVWDEVTTAVFPEHPRYGVRAGSRNPLFLDVERLKAEVLAPWAALERPSDANETRGPFLVQLTPMPAGLVSERALVAKVDDFISRLPSGHRWAFELRNAELFGSRWLDMLRANRAAHVFTYWTAMPSLREQLRARAITSPFTVVRLMLPPYTRYASRRAEMAPFDKIVESQNDMRSDVVDILRAAAEAGCDEGFVLVNNKAEGSAPLTVRGLAKMTVHAFSG
jgi:uncharacterized protein YecE (DUF72 family)